MTMEPTPPVPGIGLEQEMRDSYLDYAMSVIVSRALPSIEDGLKPVQRRIIWGMFDGGARAGSAYRKSARIVGDVMGRYHPHGDAPVYEAMVRMAQGFSMRYPLVDGQGNFGSIDGDPPAAQRYTEARMAAIAEEMIADIDQNTVDFRVNYDGSHNEPVVLPSRIPNLLLNGSAGIAVGMATNIPPHNFNEIADAIALLIDQPEATLEDLLTHVKGPDFPTAGIALVGKDSEQVRLAYGEGHGRVVMHARTVIEESARADRSRIVVTELPYQVNKATLIEKMADLVRDRKIEGIADLRDESDRTGMRIVIELKRDGQAAQVRNLLYKHTAMRSSFAINMMAIVDGQPRRVGLKRALELYIDHRRNVIRRRTEHQLEKARDREHILEGLLKAIDILDWVIATVRGADSANAALALLQGGDPLPQAVITLLEQRNQNLADNAVNPFDFSEAQARAILDMQLRRLAALERQALQDEYDELLERINYLEDLLANPRKIELLIRDDMVELKKKFGDDRRTEIIEADPESFSEEDLVPHQESVITLSQRGYIKRTPLEDFRVQRRGGTGSRGAAVREEDALMRLVVCDSHDNLLFFTESGKVYHLHAYDIPDSKKSARGTFITNLIEMETGDRVTTIIAVRDYTRDFMVLGTARGVVKKTPLSDFAEVRRNGKIAMRLDDGDALVAVRMATNESHIMMVSSHGQAIRFKIDDLREASRTSGGVRGIKLPAGAYVAGVETLDDGEQLLVITEKGLGKRTNVSEYPLQGRGGQGVKTVNITDRTGNVAACRIVRPDQELMLISRDGVVLRTNVDKISLIGRNTQGVAIMNVGEGDQVSAIAAITLTNAAGQRSQRQVPGSTNGQTPAADEDEGDTAE
ncbi:MAG: DNA gyrase subunit A [Dehalococcoidia bacterium]|nr:DNA gyrase subunit A [Dehalococcoidia bacterium]